jgi:alkylation response protein AidB-like acyl-CoA dehydrogenase
VDFTLDETRQEITGLAGAVLRRDSDRGWQGLADAGLLALALPAELGGDGFGALEIALVLTEVGRAGARVPALSTLALGVLPIKHLGSTAQQTALLPAIAAGEALVTAAPHEPSAPFPAEPSTTAIPSGGGWLVSGTKTCVPYASEAVKILVPVSMPGGPAVFLVDPRADGVTLVETRNASGSPESTVQLAGVRCDRADQLGDGDAVRVLHQYALAGAAALADGTLAGALELASGHVRTREQFGRPLATFQAVAQQIADVYIASRTLHLAAMSAAWRLSAGLDADTDLEVAAYWLAEEAPRALATCHHLHGGLGLDITYALHRFSSAIKDLSRFVGGSVFRLGELGELVVT